MSEIKEYERTFLITAIEDCIADKIEDCLNFTILCEQEKERLTKKCLLISAESLVNSLPKEIFKTIASKYNYETV